MSVHVEPKTTFNLTIKDLECGQLAECENGTIAIKLSDLVKTGDNSVINIVNGVGGYTDISRFRLLKNATIKIYTNEDGYA
jgi:hypothetical protein